MGFLSEIFSGDFALFLFYQIRNRLRIGSGPAILNELSFEQNEWIPENSKSLSEDRPEVQ